MHHSKLSHSNNHYMLTWRHFWMLFIYQHLWKLYTKVSCFKDDYLQIKCDVINKCSLLQYSSGWCRKDFGPSSPRWQRESARNLFRSVSLSERSDSGPGSWSAFQNLDLKSFQDIFISFSFYWKFSYNRKRVWHKLYVSQPIPSRVSSSFVRL